MKLLHSIHICGSLYHVTKIINLGYLVPPPVSCCIMASKECVSGSETVRYRVVRGYFYPLVLACEQDLPKLAAKLFEVTLIGAQDLENARNTHQPLYDRAQALMRTVLKNIELDQANFEKFVEILRQFSDIADELESSLKKEEDSFPPYPTTISSLPKQHSRRYSDSDVVRSKHRKSLEVDSGIPNAQISMYLGGDLLEELDTQQLQPSSGDESLEVCVPEVSVHNGSDDLVVPHAAVPANSASSTDPATQIPVSRVSSDGAVPAQLGSFTPSEDWNLKLENTYLKSEKEHCTAELNDLKKTLEVLEADRQRYIQEIRLQGIVINEKDKEIEKLKTEQAEKDKRVESLEIEKAKKEKIIGELRDQCMRAEREIQSTRCSYEEKISQLQKNLDEVRANEEKTRHDLDTAKDLLAKAELEKVKEVAKLRDICSKLKEIKNKLQYAHRIAEERRKTELAVQDKKIAEAKTDLERQQRETAEANTKLARRDKEIAEMKEQRAQEERRKSEDGRRKSELKVKELEEQLKQLQLKYEESKK